MPKVWSSQRGEEEHNDNGEDALNWARDDAKSECLGVVFVPGLDVEGEESWGGQVCWSSWVKGLDAYMRRG